MQINNNLNNLLFLDIRILTYSLMKHRNSDFSGLLINKRITFEKGKTICGDKYIISNKIGEGTFGEVYYGIQAKGYQNKGSRQVAIKIESEINSKNPQLLNEGEIIKNLRKGYKDVEGIPQVYDCGIEGGYTYMVMQLLGPTLHDLMMICNRRFTLKTTILLVLQILERLQFIHSKGYVYRDIKPQNFIMGIGDKSSTVHVVDFGLSKKYRDELIGLHYPYREDRTMVGTVRYTSINSHLGIQQSRRDDLEALCYLMIYFLNGNLPWQGIKGDGKIEKQHVITQKKLKITNQELCQNLPFQIYNFVSHCKDLSYYDDPDYKYLASELNNLYMRMGYVLNTHFDWVSIKSSPPYRTTHLTIKIGDESNELDKDQESDSISQDQIISQSQDQQLMIKQE